MAYQLTKQTTYSELGLLDRLVGFNLLHISFIQKISDLSHKLVEENFMQLLLTWYF